MGTKKRIPINRGDDREDTAVGDASGAEPIPNAERKEDAPDLNSEAKAEGLQCQENAHEVRDEDISSADHQEGSPDLEGEGERQPELEKSEQAAEPEISQQTDINSLQKQIDELTAEKEQLIYDLQRERASFINYRQRVEEEKACIRRYGAQDLAFDLLCVLDYFEASLNFENQNCNLDSVIQGVKFTIDEFKRILAKHGIEEIKSDVPFDPTIHEAFCAEVTDEIAPGTILKVHRKGYMYKDKVLRPALVTVAQASESVSPNVEKCDDFNQTEVGHA